VLSFGVYNFWQIKNIYKIAYEFYKTPSSDLARWSRCTPKRWAAAPATFPFYRWALPLSQAKHGPFFPFSFFFATMQRTVAFISLHETLCFVADEDKKITSHVGTNFGSNTRGMSACHALPGNRVPRGTHFCLAWDSAANALM